MFVVTTEANELHAGLLLVKMMCTVYEIMTSDSRPEDEGNKFLINGVTFETTVIFTGTPVRTCIVHSEKYLNEKRRANLQAIQRSKILVIFLDRRHRKLFF